jgi:hypothetical protein
MSDLNQLSAASSNPGISFSIEDCAVFSRYPTGSSWGDVAKVDQSIFKNVWTKLKSIAQALEKSSNPPIPLRASTSLYTPNGKSPKEIWCCVYASIISNKSYALQVALIISERGAEVCFCQGSGTSQVSDPAKKRELEEHFANMRRRLTSVPQELVAAVEKSKKREWFYRKSWLTKPNETDFPSLTEWLAYAGGPEGSAASVSLYFSPAELERLGTEIFPAFQDTLNTFGPILRAVYSTPTSSHYWIFQWNPDQFDVDGYIGGRQEVVWSVRQHKDRILAGDRVLLWRSGASGGVIADCSVIDPPSTDILEDAQGLWKEKPDAQTGEMRCRLRVEDSFVETPIARAAVKAVLPELSIVKAPQGTNFEITQTDYNNIIKLRAPKIASFRFGSAARSLALLAIRKTHMRIGSEFLNCFIPSLCAKPFVILTGNSGTGKTKLAELIAQWFCGEEEGRLALVPVGADWTDNRNVLGFVNHIRPTQPEGETEGGVPVYQSTGILDLLLAADNDPTKPYFLILDEMNLSHVERYFADFLSAMESRLGELHLHREGRNLPRKPGGPADVPESLQMPRNVFVIGTVNVDETTYMFSPKVLDRANVIEFRVHPSAPAKFLESGGQPISEIEHAPTGYAEAFLELSKRARGLDGLPPLALAADPATPPEDAKEGLQNCIDTITDLFALMQASHQEFAFRSMAEMLRFLAVDYELTPDEADWEWQTAVDAQILQKILPKLHGSKRKLGPLLATLATYCEKGSKGDAGKMQESQTAVESYAAQGEKKCAEPLFPASHRKLCEMILAVRRDQFVSFIQ